MAKFSQYFIKSGTSGQTAWKEIRNHLVTAESVEVIVNDGQDGGFWLRVWDDYRQDTSNSPDADPNANY